MPVGEFSEEALAKAVEALVAEKQDGMLFGYHGTTVEPEIIRREGLKPAHGGGTVWFYDQAYHSMHFAGAPTLVIANLSTLEVEFGADIGESGWSLEMYVENHVPPELLNIYQKVSD